MTATRLLRSIPAGRGTMVLCLLTAAMLADASWSKTIFVDANFGDDARTGLDAWTNAVSTISNGVARAAQHAADTVLVTTGRYAVTTNIVVTNAITLRGWNAGALDPTNTIVDGQGVARCLYLSNIAATVAGFTLTNGNGAGHVNATDGGGVYMTAGTLSNCLILGNTADLYGGGVYAVNTNTLIVDSRIEGNRQTNAATGTGNAGGGGVYLSNYARILRCDVIGNESLTLRNYQGGGGVTVRNYGYIYNCMIADNSASNCGGGVNLIDLRSVPLFHDTTIARNNAKEGGGVWIHDPISGKVEGVTIVSNSASSSCGGVRVFYSTSGGRGCVFSNCTVNYNTSLRDVGGIHIASGAAISTNTVNDFKILDSTISYNRVLTNNINSTFAGGVYVLYYGLEIDRCIIQGNQSYRNAGISLPYWTTNKPNTVRNSLIVDNLATGANGTVGGLAISGPNGWIANCTIVSNQAVSAIGGMNLLSGVSASNTICYHNDAPTNPDWTGAPAAMARNCMGTNDFGQWPDNITNAPVFVNIAVGDYHLVPASPGVDVGANEGWMLDGVDLDGRPRIDRFIRQVDMGCYEYMPRGSMFSFR